MAVSLKHKLQFIAEGGSVIRYHTRPGIKPDTDAHHSHGVVMLCALLAGDDDLGRTKASAYLLMAAATHDLGEQVASDVGAPTKRLLPGFADVLKTLEQKTLKSYGLEYTTSLSRQELSVLALADNMDGLLYCCREIALGNRNALLIWRRWSVYFEKLLVDTTVTFPPLSERAANLYDAIKEIYHETINPNGPDFDCFDYVKS